MTKLMTAFMIQDMLTLYMNLVSLGERVSRTFTGSSGLDVYVRPVYWAGMLAAVHLTNRKTGENAQFYPGDLVTEPLLVLRRLGYEVPAPKGRLTQV